ncbi:MAG: ACT domain-containing protein [Oscillospiraceae bacterium]|jgi:ACT domain-containing protein|nr:ACT domain-containing protein [Oscillospiraceae bacterium]
MRAVITVIGKDMVGILAGVSGICAESGANVTDVTQSVLQDLFAMIMMVEISDSKTTFHDFREKLTQYGEDKGLSVHIMHDDIFNSMHRI